ncbi:MAG: NAD-dependent epimerase/dehydratase family protein [Verrucomicrobiia bacterium]
MFLSNGNWLPTSASGFRRIVRLFFMKVLVTGGAGFIGSHLCRRLVCEGVTTTVLDNFNPQVHGAAPERNSFLPEEVTLLRGDVNDRAALFPALAGQDAAIHLAAETGTGQSMYQVERYSRVNIGGTSLLMEYLANQRGHGIRKVIVASSRAVYGEGTYRCERCGQVHPRDRRVDDLRSGCFEPRCPNCAEFCSPLATSEDAPLRPTSFYGLTKQAQEQITLLFARALKIPAFALRFQNVYGAGQSLRNPYTGILAIFSNLARANRPINIFEDGLETRDFVYVEDAVEAIWRCLVSEAREGDVLNVGSGQRTTVLQLARHIVGFFESTSELRVTGDFRLGDIRHNFADLERAERKIGYCPKWSFHAGMREFLSWAGCQKLVEGGYEASLCEMQSKGLMLKGGGR